MFHRHADFADPLRSADMADIPAVARALKAARIPGLGAGAATAAGPGRWDLALGVDDGPGWHRWPCGLRLAWTGGDPAVLSVSEDGRDAWAVHLADPERRPDARLRADVPAGAWLTLESLGRGTTLRLVLARPDARPEAAPADWRPGPDPPRRG